MIRSEALLCIILIITFLRASIKRFKGNYNTDYLFISMFVLASPLKIIWAIFELTQKTNIRGRETLVNLGRFGSVINLNVGFAFAMVLIICGFLKIKKKLFRFENNKWFYILIGLSIISYFNPYNTFPAAIFPMLWTVVQFLFLFILFESNFDRATVVKGAYDGLASLTILMFILVIAYPILDLKWCANLFHGKAAFMNSLRREGYPSAVSVFDHPNLLGFFTIIPISFFFSSLLLKYKKKPYNILYLLMNVFTCFFTFSRTSYVAIFIALIILLIIYQNKMNFINRKIIIGFASVFISILLLFWYLATYQNLLLFKDAGAMLKVRQDYWVLGYEIWQRSKILGIGLNTHVYYLTHNDFSYTGAANSFTINIAIHNIHFIVLAEAGLIGIVVWFYLLFDKIKQVSNFHHSPTKECKVLQMTFFMILIGVIIAGFFDVSPSNPYILPMIIFFGFFSRNIFQQDIKTKDEVKI